MPDFKYRHWISLRHRAGPLDLEVEFFLDAPWTAIFAPSGAGKTTILRMIAGLDHPEYGDILLNNQGRLTALDTARGVFVPPHKRGVFMVSQQPALFPHLTVAENVRYGMHRVQLKDDYLGQGRGVAALLERYHVPGHLHDEKPSRLSGGERQRVAIARAIARGGGNLLMLDEPFTGLEADLRDELIQELRQWSAQSKTPVLLVTHDLGEVFAAGAHVLKMESGRIVAQGPAAEVLADERDRLIQRLQSGTSRLSADS